MGGHFPADLLLISHLQKAGFSLDAAQVYDLMRLRYMI